MKQLILLYCLLLFSSHLMSQSYSFSGKVLDKNNQTPIEYATITLHQVSDSSLLEGVVSDQDGFFEIKAKSDEAVFLQIQFMGYRSFRSESFKGAGNKALGSIGLSVNTETLGEVEVSGKAITVIQKLDKQIFDAGQFQNAQGGTAADILMNLPSVSIDGFGQISVRGTSGFLVMLNGKPVQSEPMVLLRQLAANAVQDIEIITAPSAKYDPDGKAGIINIKTRQSIGEGLYILSNVLLGLPSVEDYDNANNTPRYGADFNLNYRAKKWDLSAGLDYRRYDISGRREGYVNTYLADVLTEFPSDGERSFDEENYAARLSAIFSPDKNQSIALGLYAGKRTKERTADILYTNQQRTRIANNEFLGTEAYFDLYERTGDVLSGGDVINAFTYFNENLRVRRGDFFISSLDYSYTFPQGANLKFSTLYERTILGGPTDNANLAWPNTEEIIQLQFNDNDNPLDGFRAQIDFQQPFAGGNWESGYQFRYLQHPGDFIYLDRDLNNNVWIENPLFTNSIELRRSIHALYSQVAGEKGRWQYIAGLRGEYFDRTVDIASPDETFELDQFNLFPSLNLSYNPGQNWLIKAAYSRRIERTTTFKMTPFPEREHSETLEQGDAELLPEYIDLVEVGVVKNWEDNTVFATAYYRQVENVINRVNTVFNDTILNRIYTNVGVAEAIGLEVGTTFYPHKNWRVYLGGNVFNYQIQGTLFEDDINTSNTIFSINANTNLYLGKDFNLQLALNYLSERVTAQGRDSRFYNPSLTIRKSFADKKWTLSLQWLNMDLGLLDSNEQRITTVRPSFFTTTNYVYEVDILQLNITYQLNQSSKKINLPESEFGKKEF